MPPSLRMAYLKKHAIVHQYSVCEMEKRLSLLEYNKLISGRSGSQVPTQYKAMLPDAEQRHLHQIREFYYKQRECLSAFQYVQHQRIEKNNKRWVHRSDLSTTFFPSFFFFRWFNLPAVMHSKKFRLINDSQFSGQCHGCPPWAGRMHCNRWTKISKRWIRVRCSQISYLPICRCNTSNHLI